MLVGLERDQRYLLSDGQLRKDALLVLVRRLVLARLVLPAICVVLAVGYARSFFVEARASNGPDFVAGYRGAEATCAAPTVDRAAVRISPYPATDDWFVEIPCSRIR